MRKSSVVVGACAAALVLFSSSSAWAHASFVGGASGYPVNTDQTLTLNVPHERDGATFNVDVVIAIPAGWTALSCQTKATWTCSLGTVDTRPVVRFTKNEGVEPAEDQAFRFTARTAPTVERFGFPTVQTYNTGEIVRWIGAAGAEKPTPMLATLPAGSAPQTTPSTTNPDASPATATTVTAPSTTTVATTASAPTTMLPVPSTTALLASATDADSDDGTGAGLVAGIVVALVVVAGAGAAFAFRRRTGNR